MIRSSLLVLCCLVAGATQQTSTPATDVRERPIDLDQGRAALTEPHIAASPTDPDRLAGAAIRLDGGDRRVVAFATDDGGDSWWSRELDGLAELSGSGDPWLRWGAEGTLWLSVLAHVPAGDDERVAIYLYRSDDGGETWSSPMRMPWTDRGSADHPILASGNGSGAPLWVLATYGLSGFLALRSSAEADAFAIVSEYVPDDLNNNLGGAVAWDDRVVFTYFDMSSRGAERPLWAVRSTPAGFERTLVARGVVPWGFPTLAAGATPASGPPPIYAAWSRAEGAEGLDVVVSRSDDGGGSWSEPVVVNHDRSPTFRGGPQIVVREDGLVAVSWNDRRHDEGEQCSDLYLGLSTDGGRTFQPEVRVSARTSCPFDAEDTRPSRRWPMGGDYWGMAYDAAGRLHVAWSEVRDRRFELRSAVVEVPSAR